MRAGYYLKVKCQMVKVRNFYNTDMMRMGIYQKLQGIPELPSTSMITVEIF